MSDDHSTGGLKRTDEGTICPRCGSAITQASWVDDRCYAFKCLNCGQLLPNGDHSLQAATDQEGQR